MKNRVSFAAALVVGTLLSTVSFAQQRGPSAAAAQEIQDEEEVAPPQARQRQAAPNPRGPAGKPRVGIPKGECAKQGKGFHMEGRNCVRTVEYSGGSPEYDFEAPGCPDGPETVKKFPLPNGGTRTVKFRCMSH
ncbi:MAG: hypothetical protein JWO43_183 [Candidatus Adlerbacteria bacterium]|nr:hypothetical protein [Candidatus Adlerbacteria bacterium]